MIKALCDPATYPPKKKPLSRGEELFSHTNPRYRLNAAGALEPVSPFCETRAAQERNNAVVNARKARCQNLESNFIFWKMNGGKIGGSGLEAGRAERPLKRRRSDVRPRNLKRDQPPASHRLIEASSSDSSTMGFVT